MSKLAQLREEVTKVDKNSLEFKMVNAEKIGKKDRDHFAVFKEFAKIQMDILYMREDEKGYRYILNVVDCASHACDSEPCYDLKGERICEALNQMKKRKYIKFDEVKVCSCDNGSEFKNKHVKDWMEYHDIDMRFTVPDRKTQNAMVEAYNNIISKAIYEKASIDEMQENARVKPNWSSYLPQMVKVLNKKTNLTKPSAKPYFKDPKATPSEINNRLHVGDVVHVRLNKPYDFIGEKGLYGNFRNGDIRFEKETTKVTNIIIEPNTHVRYLVEKYGSKTSFLRKELLLHGEPLKDDILKNDPKPPNETKPQAPTTKGKGPVLKYQRI